MDQGVGGWRMDVRDVDIVGGFGGEEGVGAVWFGADINAHFLAGCVVYHVEGVFMVISPQMTLDG